MFTILLSIIKGMRLFLGSYSINVSPDPLSQEEEQICIDRMLKDDKSARDKLIEHNLRLVAHIVKKFDSKRREQDDLISIGTIGLIKGIDSYDSDKKNVETAIFLQFLHFFIKITKNLYFYNLYFGQNAYKTYVKTYVKNSHNDCS